MDHLPTRRDMVFVDQLLAFLDQSSTHPKDQSTSHLLFPNVETLKLGPLLLCRDSKSTKPDHETRPRYLRRLCSPPIVCLTNPLYPETSRPGRLLYASWNTASGSQYLTRLSSALRALHSPLTRTHIHLHNMQGRMLRMTAESPHDYYVYWPTPNPYPSLDETTDLRLRDRDYIQLICLPHGETGHGAVWEDLSDSASEAGEFDLVNDGSFEQSYTTRSDSTVAQSDLRPTWTIIGDARRRITDPRLQKGHFPHLCIDALVSVLRASIITALGTETDETTNTRDVRSVGIKRMSFIYPEVEQSCPVCGQSE